MSDETTPEPAEIRPEMFQRVQQERDEARGKLEEVQSALKDVALRDRAYDYFKSVDGVSDPYATASAAVRDVTLKDVPSEELADKLSDWYNSQKAIFGSVGQASPAEQAEPAATETLPPGAARTAPSPANTGALAQSEPLTWNSPEVVGARKRNDVGQIRDWLKQGRLVPSPGNPYARQ